MNNFLEFNYEVENKDLMDFEKIFNNLLIITKDILKLGKPISMSINYISDEKSIELNTEYRQKKYIGDVISFPINDEFGIYDQLDFKEIGDIFIAPNEAIRKAKLYNHSFYEEMCWLFTHGLLHILGYDHEENENNAKIMFDLTDQILQEINIKYNMPF
ncbi:rRNA maturation RNase YbeY [Spiroplasma taiwanense]|uniref:Endoribonuclease YbeY n=1 Tax=Spiroplasma taiwanense CT-1 TaxID=1276220 RepID=S5LUF4_9MOLU|nr:rRNA maturation RNase YbeY [Spiroplasma taiwanense]AGR41419.1 metalloprotease [Spiroplasma taiwanense CT-1]